MTKQVLTSFVCLVCFGLLPISSPKAQEDTAELTSLQDLRWQNRILIGELPAEGGYWQHLLNAPAQARERKLVVLLSQGDKWIHNPVHLPLQALPLWVKQSPGELFLIGLDGGIKARYELGNVKLSEVFADIDGMPMRRAELRQKQP